jgi:phage terminase large subunit-like protein
VRLAAFQRYIIDRLFEYDPASGALLHDRAIIGMGKGGAKTELCSQIGLAELLGPLAPVSPRVVISAASWKQANRLFGAARLGIEEGPLARFFPVDHIMEDRILHPEQQGVLERVAAIDSTNEGGLLTDHLGDELHEWEGEQRERSWTVHGKSLRKRRVLRPHGASGGLQIGISTAGAEKNSLLGRLYDYGKAVAAGETEDPAFLFLWWEADSRWNLDEPRELVQAILEGNPAVGSFMPLDLAIRNFNDPIDGRAEGERLVLNRWVAGPRKWIDDDTWASRAVRAGWPMPGSSVCLGFDGSYNRDTTALAGSTVEGYHFTVGLFESDSGDPIDRTEVNAAVDMAMDRWQVRWLGCDPPGWHTEIEAWEAKYGWTVMPFETNQPTRMGPACTKFRADVYAGALSHDGDPRTSRHVANCRTRDTTHGQVIVKEHKDSVKKIDLAVAHVISREMWRATASLARQVTLS